MPSNRPVARTSPFEAAKRVAARGLSFHIVRDAGVFPQRDVLNAFLRCGYDDLPCERVLRWEPFSLTPAAYDRLVKWWRSAHPGSRVHRLSVRRPEFSLWFTRAIDRKAANKRRLGGVRRNESRQTA